MIKFRVLGYASACLFWLITAPSVADPGHVIIDSAERAYTVFIGIPRELAEDKFRELKAAAEKQGPAQVIAWESFANDLDKYVTSKIVKNEYPEVRIAEDIAALLAKFPMTPIGLTWNGGLAITRNDYAHAQRAYRRYLADPNTPVREADIRADPVHPKNHTIPLLGR